MYAILSTAWQKKPRLLLNLADFENLEYNVKLKTLGMGVLLQLVAKTFLLQKSSPRIDAVHILARQNVKDWVGKGF